uniref:Synaptopodin 2-like protein n=1 Tax=Astyanax mexicanus TaxID=7994 RepID=A0A3B1ITK5_ASTMX
MVTEEVVVTLSGGAPWGFRLQGGAEQQKPLQVAKVRKRSKACRAGLREADELMSINDVCCGELSHSEAMNLIDSGRGILQLRIKRSEPVYESALRALSSPTASKLSCDPRSALMSPTSGLEFLTSPPDSEAYYGETDSDADIAAQEKQRRQRRRSPNSSPAKTNGSGWPLEEENSEMSGYESAPDTMHKNSSENSDQSPSGAAEVDSGFQEPPTVPPPLVSPERAKEALLLASHRQLVPMVGPVENPVDEELTVTYMDKAKQAKLHRSESVQDKQVKEARTKCRTIASLLTDAPNPHSKGVLMFKKRRQRAKKYTLTYESLFPGSESELDEDCFSAAPDPTWDSGYLDILDRRTSACVVTDKDPEGSPGLSATSGKGAQLFEQQRKRAEKHTSTPVTLTPAPMPQQHRTSMVLSSPGQTSITPMTGTLPEQSDPSSGNSIHNRTAKPFAPGCVSHRASTAPVIFRPNTAKKAPLQAQAVGPPSVFSPSSSVTSPPFSPAINYPPFSPQGSGISPFSPTSASAPPYNPATPSPSHKVSFNPYISVATTTSGTAVTPVPQQYPLSNSGPVVSSREQRISVPATRTGILQEARRRSTNKPMFTKPEEKKPVSYNPELLSLVQNFDDRSRSGAEHGFESGPEEDFLNLGAEACNFMQAQRGKMAPPVAPKPGTQRAELFARRQSRMDRYVVDKQPKSPAQPREPSPTPSLSSNWKYSPNVRAPPPISYNPLLSPSCPPVAQRGNKANEPPRSGIKAAPGQNKQGIKALDFMSRQPYQLNSSLFSYGGGVPQTQVPVKSPRVYEIKRFSTPPPMSAPTTLRPTVIVPRSATTLAEPLWRSDLSSPPPFSTAAVAPELSPLQNLQVPRPRFSTSNMGLQPKVWRPGSMMY